MEASATETASGPSFELGKVNVDSLKEILNQLGNTYPWQDEVSKLAYHDQVNSIGEAGDPHATDTNVELSDAEKEIASLKAQLAEAQAGNAGNAGGTS